MRSLFFTLAAELALLATSATAHGLPGMNGVAGLWRPVHDEAFPPASLTAKPGGGPKWTTFEQFIDHGNPGLGKFSQRYIWNGDYYAGPGSPVFIMSGGEGSIDGFEEGATNQSLAGAMAQASGAGIIILEHRYWGQSSPYDELTVKNLQYLTLNNSILDLTYFAHNAVLPFDQNRTSTPDKAPWVLVGCSYSGALSAWVRDLAPGTFWAYSCGSAVVEAKEELWQLFDSAKKAMPQNCSTDYAKMIDSVDKVLLGHDEKAKLALKTKFGLEDLEDDDFATALNDGPSSWQSVWFGEGYDHFHKMCDYVENQWPGSNATRPGPGGVGAAKALDGYAKWWMDIHLPNNCANFGYWKNPLETACWDTHNKTNPMYTDLTPANAINRQWTWMLCNEPFKWWQDRGQTDISSRLNTKAYSQNICQFMFPPEGEYTFGIAKGLDTHHVNQITGGWRNVDTERVMYAVGELDTWRSATVASFDRPGGQLPNTPQHPVFVIPGAAHCSDFWTVAGEYNADLKAIIDSEVQIMTGWVEEFYQQKGKSGH